MKLIESVLTSKVTKRSKLTLSMVLDNGNIYHFYCLPEGVHWTSTRRYRGRYEEAVKRELGRRKAKVVAEEEAVAAYPGTERRSQHAQRASG